MEETQKLVNTIIDGIQEKKGRGIVTVDLRNIITAPSSYFVIWTGRCDYRLSRRVRA